MIIGCFWCGGIPKYSVHTSGRKIPTCGRHLGWAVKTGVDELPDQESMNNGVRVVEHLMTAYCGGESA